MEDVKWAADGKNVYFTRKGGLYYKDVSKNEDSLIAYLNSTGNDEKGFSQSFAVSNDGDRVAFQFNTFKSAEIGSTRIGSDICVYSKHDKSIVKVSDSKQDPWQTRIEWSPDGKKILAIRSEDGNFLNPHPNILTLKPL